MVIVLFVCFFLNVPIGFSLGAASLAALLISDIPIMVMSQRMVAGVNSFALLAIPLFMLAGSVMERGGVSKRIVKLASALVGHLTGGLSSVAILATCFFAAISGSVPATVAAIGTLTIPEMHKRGYDLAYSSAIVASAGPLGAILPPSITIVIFGIVANVSVGRLLIAGIVPGILIGIGLIATNIVMSRKANFALERKATGAELVKAFKDAIWALLMPIIIMAGIMTGVFTPTESAAVAVAYGLFVGFFIYRELKLTDIVPCFYKASLNSAMILMLIAMANPFGWIMTAEQVQLHVGNFMLSVTNDLTVIFIIIMIVFIVLGTFMETASLIMLLVPLFGPIVQDFGMDMVHFGIISVLVLSISKATPPTGIALFAACGISGISLGQIVAKIWPFVLVSFIITFILAAFPQVTTFLPNLIMG